MILSHQSKYIETLDKAIQTQSIDPNELVRAQIAEKEWQKEEARQHNALEEKQEEERVAKQREKLQREYQEEQERVKRKEETCKSSESSLNQKAVQTDSENRMIKNKFETLKKEFDKLRDIHNKCRIQKQNVSVGTQTLTDDEMSSTNDEDLTLTHNQSMTHRGYSSVSEPSRYYYYCKSSSRWYYCEVMGDTAFHSGKVSTYSFQDYSCLNPGFHHYFCDHHYLQQNCPVHTSGYRKH